MSVPVEAELLCKAAQIILRRDVNTFVAQIAAEWDSQQVLGTLTIPADPLPGFDPIDAGDILLGRVDALASISNFPTIQIFANDEDSDPTEGGEQNWTGAHINWNVRIAVQGTTVEHTEKLIYRYKDAVYRTLLQDRTLGGAALSTNPPSVEYASIPEMPLYRAVQMTFHSAIIQAW